MSAALLDLDYREAAFRWLKDCVAHEGEVFSWATLRKGFRHGGQQVAIIAQRGIFKPRQMRLPLSITTSPSSPYGDSFGPEFLNYRYFGQDPAHPDNEGLRLAMKQQVPLVYFHGVMKGRYVAAWPVFVVGDDPYALTFKVAVDDADFSSLATRERWRAGDLADPLSESTLEPRRAYVTRLTRQRLHQTAFRERVLHAYREQCALCRLRYRELLDAAHIVPDRDEGGEPRVSNGMALCKIHHSAFDQFFLTVTPEYRVIVRGDILRESDGPMLLHGLQELHEQRIYVPRGADRRPSSEALAARLQDFLAREAGGNPQVRVR